MFCGACPGEGCGQTSAMGGGLTDSAMVSLSPYPRPRVPRSSLRVSPDSAGGGLPPPTDPLDPLHKAPQRQGAIARCPQIPAFQQADQVIRPQPEEPQDIGSRPFGTPGLLLLPLHIQRAKPVVLTAPMAADQT